MRGNALPVQAMSVGHRRAQQPQESQHPAAPEKAGTQNKEGAKQSILWGAKCSCRSDDKGEEALTKSVGDRKETTGLAVSGSVQEETIRQVE